MTNTSYTIGIVTYHARFEQFFKPLIKKLAATFPDREIICILNGHPDRSLQIQYLDRATEFLNGFPNIRYLTYDTHQSLAKCWNQLVILSHTDKILILNDDTQVSELFRTELEDVLNMHHTYTFNGSWSHFVISKSTLRQVGWFDERLLGIGHEDGDYGYRMIMHGLPIQNVLVHGLRNHVAPQTEPGWKDISTVSKENKYSKINEDIFNTKWITPLNSPDVDEFAYRGTWNDTPIRFSLAPGMDTPEFYDRSVLSASITLATQKKTRRVSSARLAWERMYFRIGRTLARIFRHIRSVIT